MIGITHITDPREVFRLGWYAASQHQTPVFRCHCPECSGIGRMWLNYDLVAGWNAYLHHINRPDVKRNGTHD